MSILLAYDGKPMSQRALDYAIEHSVRYEQPLYILTVVKEDQVDPDDVDESIRQYMENARDMAVDAGALAHTIIMTGRPDETVLDVADRYDCDTIIVGKSNRSSLDRLLMGSVSTYVVKNANCTVIVVSGSSERSDSFLDAKGPRRAPQMSRSAVPDKSRAKV